MQLENVEIRRFRIVSMLAINILFSGSLRSLPVTAGVCHGAGLVQYTEHTVPRCEAGIVRKNGNPDLAKQHFRDRSNCRDHHRENLIKEFGTGVPVGGSTELCCTWGTEPTCAFFGVWRSDQNGYGCLRRCGIWQSRMSESVATEDPCRPASHKSPRHP